MSILEVRLRESVSIRARAEPLRPLDCNKHFCANRVIYGRSRRGGRAHEEAEGGSAPSSHVARWYQNFASEGLVVVIVLWQHAALAS